jgi:Tfp pilus assembly protein PilV
MKNKKGQSLIEVVISVGVIVLVVTGVITLIVNTVNIKSATYQRKRASEVAEKVIENLLEQKTSNKDNFWTLDPNKINKVTFDFSGYTYDVGFSQVTTNTGCVVSPPNCANATITVNWGDGEKVIVSRFFSK